MPSHQVSLQRPTTEYPAVPDCIVSLHCTTEDCRLLILERTVYGHYNPLERMLLCSLATPVKDPTGEMRWLLRKWAGNDSGPGNGPEMKAEMEPEMKAEMEAEMGRK